MFGKNIWNKPPINKIENNENLPAIPIESVAGWKNIPVKECGEELVPVGAFSPFSDCDTSAAYFGERGEGDEMNFLGQPVDRQVSLITHFVRKGILEKIKKAQESLPEGYYFKFFDNYRPLDVQQKLFDVQKEVLQKQHPDWDNVKLEAETQTYVSLPSPNKERGTTQASPHSTGGVVDLTIIKMNPEGQELLKKLNQDKQIGKLTYPIENESEEIRMKMVEAWITREAESKKWTREYTKSVRNNWLVEYRYAREKAKIFKENTTSLNMGTKFDYFGPEAGIRYFEELSEKRELNSEEKEALQNRRFFYKIMKEAGFSNYPEEWWHFSYGDGMDAANTKKPFACYGGAQFTQKNLDFERSRRIPRVDAEKRVGEKGLFVNFIETDPSK